MVRAFALLLLAVVLWGLQPLVVKVALGVFSVGFAAFARAVTAAAFFGVIAFLSRSRRGSAAPLLEAGARRAAVWLVVGGMGMGLGTVLWNASLTRTTVGASSVLQMGGNLLVVLYGITILRERCGALRGAGLLLTLAGLFVVSWNGESLSALLSSRYFQGNMMALAAGTAWGLASIAQKVTVQGRSSVSVSVVIFTFAALACGAAALPGPALVGEFSPVLLAALLLTGLLGMGLGNVLFTESMRTITVSVGAALSAAAPLISLTAAALLLHEPVSAYLMAGAPITCVGVTAAIASEPGTAVERESVERGA